MLIFLKKLENLARERAKAPNSLKSSEESENEIIFFSWVTIEKYLFLFRFFLAFFPSNMLCYLICSRTNKSSYSNVNMVESSSSRIAVSVVLWSEFFTGFHLWQLIANQIKSDSFHFAHRSLARSRSIRSVVQFQAYLTPLKLSLIEFQFGGMQNREEGEPIAPENQNEEEAIELTWTKQLVCSLENSWISSIVRSFVLEHTYPRGR